MSAEVAQVLRDAKALIADPDRWMKGAFSNADDTCFCAMGAVRWAVADGKKSWRLVWDARDVLESAVPQVRGGNMSLGPVERFNDMKATTHADVMAAFDRAIAAEGLS